MTYKVDKGWFIALVFPCKLAISKCITIMQHNRQVRGCNNSNTALSLILNSSYVGEYIDIDRYGTAPKPKSCSFSPFLRLHTIRRTGFHFPLTNLGPICTQRRAITFLVALHHGSPRIRIGVFV